ncbi:MAG: response regulator [Saprospiraceae bacterium]|nr:response regulator [Saprospiraceae bacterium]
MKSVKILIVEDQKIVARVLETMLTKWGYDVVDCATSSVEALSSFKKYAPDLALVDINIEGAVDGIETVNQFNAIRAIPVVYLTAEDDSSTVDRAKKTNPSAYLLKPFDERSLRISLEMAFNTFSNRIIPPQYKTVIEKKNSNNLSANEVKLGADVILQIEDAIFIKQNYRFVKLNKSELLYLEADRNHTYIQTIQHRYIVRMTLTTVQERLNHDKLVRTHRSFVVNTQKIQEFSESEIIINGKSLPFSSAYKEDFFKKFVIK